MFHYVLIFYLLCAHIADSWNELLILQNGLVFVVGSRSSQMFVSGRQHSADDLIATVLAVEPMKFIYRGRFCALCLLIINHEERDSEV